MKYSITTRYRYTLRLICTISCLLLFVQAIDAAPASQENGSEVRVTIIHTNDIYEVMPVSGGTLGGVARLATLKQQLLEENPNTILTMSGDLHGPSGLGLATVDDELLAGKQNVAVMNKVGLDYFTFGDHEFDIYSGEQHLARLAETEFPMISSNVFASEDTSFEGVETNDIFTATNAAGDAVRVGLFGITEPIPRSKVPISYTNHISAATEQVALLEPQVDVLIALTHFGVAVDQDTAQRFPEIDLILGGDDHEHMKVEAGSGLATIFKSDSNVRAVQVIDLYYDTAAGTLRIEDRLQPITDEIADDPTTQAELDKWVQIGFDGFRSQGVDPTEVVAKPTVDLDGFANSIRNGPTELTRLMVNGINATATEPELSLMFSALIRTDDLIPAGGDFTMYDVIRTFPNNFDIVSVDVPGAALKGILSFGQQSAGSGQYILSTDNVTQDEEGNWLVDGEPVEDTRMYQAGTTAEAAFGFADFGVTVAETHDLNLQQLLVQQLNAEFPLSPPVSPEDGSEVRVTIIHTNDIYEVMPVSGGTLGGVARLATLKQQLLEENPNTILTMSGDLHGPSGLGLATVDDELLAGKQNVAVMNKVGLDYFTFGDHEFDIYSGEQHLARLAETEFPMISSNVFASEDTSFEGVETNDIFTATNAAGDAVRVGLFGITEPIPRSKVPISYTNHISAATEQVALLEPQVDVLIALTHFGVAVDQDTAQRFPEIDLILGGDDHEHMKVEAGSGLATIFKSDSNVRAVQVIDLYYDTAAGTLRIEDRLQPITDEIADDPTTQAELDKWVQIGFDGFRSQGVDPTEVVAKPTVDLDGFANSIRNGPTELTRLMVNGINATATEPELSLMFSALIRTDDLIPAGGDFTMYDVIRTFPNNFDIVSVDVPGAALKGILSFGQQSAGSGQYILSTDNVTQDEDGNWLVDGEPVEDTRMYQAGTTAEAAFGFADFGVTVAETHDLNLQQLLVQQLNAEFPLSTAVDAPSALEVADEPEVESFSVFLPAILQ